MKRFELLNLLTSEYLPICVIANTERGARRWLNSNGFYGQFYYLIEI